MAGSTLRFEIGPEAEKRQFEVGLGTSAVVLEAAARLADAQSREIRAPAVHEVSQVYIAFSTGTLLGQDGAVWEATDPNGEEESHLALIRLSSTSRT